MSRLFDILIGTIKPRKFRTTQMIRKRTFYGDHETRVRGFNLYYKIKPKRVKGYRALYLAWGTKW